MRLAKLGVPGHNDQSCFGLLPNEKTKMLLLLQALDTKQLGPSRMALFASSETWQ